jgi:hypothetical protein
MGNIKIKSATPNEKILLDYLNKNASDDLANRINDGDKTLSQCWNYIVSEAKKHAKDGCACIDDTTVFGWCIHFFEEDSIKGSDFEKANKSVKTATSEDKPCEPYEESEEVASAPPAPKKPKKVKAPELDQVGFDFW